MAVLSLFSGCGGLDSGFKKAGFKIVAANEVWKPAADTYKRNHRKTRMFLGDITNESIKKEILDFFKDNDCEVIIGGPPCQAYSVAGLRKPDDPRGKLFEDYMTMVKRLKPKIFLMENVRGLLSIKCERDDLISDEMKKVENVKKLKEEKIRLLLKRKQSKASNENIKFTRKDKKKLIRLIEKIPRKEREIEPYQEKLIDKIIREFASTGYKVEWEVLNSANYGVPQTRERIIFIGTRYDTPITFPRKTHTNIESEIESGLLPWVTVRQAIDDLKERPEDFKFNHIFAVHGNDFLTRIDNTPIGGNAFDVYSHAFNRPHPNKPSYTVKENHGGVFIHYEKRRVMTPRELARLQSFDDKFVFCSTKNHVLKQIGDAVPPKLAFALANSVKKMLKRISRIENKAYIGRRPSRITNTVRAR